MEMMMSNWEKFNISNEKSILILAIVSCVILLGIYKAVYNSFLEESFMRTKARKKNQFFKIITFLIIFVPVNFFISLDKTFIIPEAILLIIAFVSMVINIIKKSLTNNYIEKFSRLNMYYKNKVSESVLSIVVCSGPFFTVFFYEVKKNIPLFNCAVIVSIVEVYILCFVFPELVT